ncbi:hypothetical protein BPMI_02209c [Candidatus Burkholderia pumila]|uniref:CidA-associated membrane protein CidB n=1 Tax=Candidatus Burkholderia pumila TaxID=1090375 RepID=A0ABR5HKW8_9BURK|nr:hypothetical protein BPMI_02209c [Candidatus Burkholderia pumila]
MRHVPAYVYVLLCVLIYVGIKRCYPRVTQHERTIVFPILLVVLGALSLKELFPLAGAQDYAWAAATLAGGALVSWVHASRWHWRLQFETRDDVTLVHMPGDPSLLATLLATFVGSSSCTSRFNRTPTLFYNCTTTIRT